jgi:[ribosomal protein S18]-alanine N-acetyltransferase
LSASAVTPAHVPAVRVRAMTPGDIDEVAALGASVATRSWSRRAFEVELADPRTRCHLVAEVAAEETGATAEVVGYAGVHVIVDEAHITTVCVRPSARRLGTATRLISALLQWAARLGVDAATLEVRAGNTAARALYRRLGFRDEGLRPRYYPDGEDAVIMWRRPVSTGDGEGH